MNITIIESAELELDDAYYYYENEFPGLGGEFVDAFRKTIKRIQYLPEAWTCIQENIRKCSFERFPFDIIFAIEEEQIVIIAISHHHRKPYYWTDRLKDEF